MEDMAVLPVGCDLQELGLAPSAVTGVTLLQQRPEHVLYRLTAGPRSFVLKWFANPARAGEVRAYALLARLGVPTLPVHGRTANALLLEDLATSDVWRLAGEADLHRPETGAAVAEWYRALHAAGRAVLADPSGAADFLHREVDSLDAATILRIGERLGLAADPVWELAADRIEALKRALCALPETLTYNDFHWTNLALSRGEGHGLRAVVFDYHLLGIGPAAGDYRNVTGSLEDPARRAFQVAYGEVDEREAILDAPVAVLHALGVAVRRPALPRWALPLVSEVTTRGLEAKLRRALDRL
jgi:SAM-dependent methyltransferase